MQFTASGHTKIIIMTPVFSFFVTFVVMLNADVFVNSYNLYQV